MDVFCLLSDFFFRINFQVLYLGGLVVLCGWDEESVWTPQLHFDLDCGDVGRGT